jgi:phosphomannomutase
VCGWEANGGFLTGSDFERNGKTLKALPTRDAMLPILAVLFSAREKGIGLTELFSRLPARYSKAALLRKFPHAVSRRIIERFSPPDPVIQTVTFDSDSVTVVDSSTDQIVGAEATFSALRAIRSELGRFFTPALGFGEIVKIDYTDGVRVYFSNGDIAHVRPSGNADELRIYAVADSQARAEEIARHGVAEPAGILRQLETEVTTV